MNAVKTSTEKVGIDEEKHSYCTLSNTSIKTHARRYRIWRCLYANKSYPRHGYQFN